MPSHKKETPELERRRRGERYAGMIGGPLLFAGAGSASRAVGVPTTA